MTTIPSAKDLDIYEPGKLRVLEIYPAWQGEGKLIGTPSVFVRFAGCTVGCHWCDTKYSWRAAQGILYEPDQLAKLVDHCSIPHVVVTGGEPLEQPQQELDMFFDALNDTFIQHITIETSGNFPAPISALKPRTVNMLFSLAPKLPSARSNYDFPDLVLWYKNIRHSDNDNEMQVKFVIDQLEDLDFIEGQLQYLQDADVSDTFGMPDIILQVCTNQSPRMSMEDIRAQVLSDMTNLQEAVIKRGWHQWVDTLRILPQLHTLQHGRKRLV